jgi:hypothetical protein
MSGVKINNIVKRSISLSPLVNKWAEDLAAERGFGTNFSAFVADLVRREQQSAAATLHDSPALPPVPAELQTQTTYLKRKRRKK